MNDNLSRYVKFVNPSLANRKLEHCWTAGLKKLLRFELLFCCQYVYIYLVDILNKST